MRSYRIIVSLALVLVFGAAFLRPADTPPAKYQWQIDDLVTTERVESYLVSPDSKWLCWSVRKWNQKDHKRYNTLFLTPIQGKQTGDIQLTREENRSTSVKWVPGKEQISFMTDREFKDTKPGNLWLMNITGGEPYPLTQFEKGIDQYDWLDADHLLFISRETDSFYEKETEEGKDTSSVVEDEEHRVITRLFHYDIKEKKVCRLTDNQKPITDFFLSENRQWVIYTVSMSVLFEQDEEIRPRYYLMNLKTKETREVFPEESLKPEGSFSWAKDNSGFYAPISHSTHPKYRMASVRKLYWYDLKTFTHREIDLQWDRDGGDFRVTDDGFVMALPDGVHFQYARYYKKGNTWSIQKIKGDIQKNISSFTLGKDGKTMIYNYSTASLPARYYLARLEGNAFTRVREVMDIKSPIFQRPLAKTEVISWTGALNGTVEGILYYPYKYEPGKKYPLVLMIHGGPNGADMDFFEDGPFDAAHAVCERGAFVLKVNYHGSSNYGLAFCESIAGHYYEYEVPDIEKGVDYLVAQGKVDPERLGVCGWSNGSILGIALILKPNRYKVACLGAGDVNWISDYGTCGFGVAFDNYYFGGPPWERVEHYIQKSPLFKLQEVNTPVLIFHGTDDRNVPYGQGMEFYRALKINGQAPVRFISFPGEGHGPIKLAHVRRMSKEELNWLDRFLFKSGPEKNEALKEGSLLAQLPKYQQIARVKDCFGIEKDSLLIPEVVEHEKKLIGRFEVTRAQWAGFDPTFSIEPGTENVPVTGITFERALAYTQWLSQKTQETYRLPGKDEIPTLYKIQGGNTLDYWAGYTLNPDDYQKLLPELAKYGDQPFLLKPVASFSPLGENLIFDLDGNAAEWVEIAPGNGEAWGGSAERPQDDKSRIKPQPLYTGLRVIKDK